MVFFGQVVVGPPGSGKTTYCYGMQQFLGGLGRKVAVVNLDPANDLVPYTAAVDIRDLVVLDDVMQQMQLGPNGAMIWAIEYVQANLDWLWERLGALPADSYLVLDLPGQVELFTHHDGVRDIVAHLTGKGCRLAAVNLVDAHYCSDVSKFISVLMMSLSTMLQLELPHVNLLSKIDMVEASGPLAYNIDFYTDVLDLSYLLQHLPADETNSGRRFRALTAALADVVEDYALVSFTPLDVQDKDSMVRVMRLVDKASGYVFGSISHGNEDILNTAAGEVEPHFEATIGATERHVSM